MPWLCCIAAFYSKDGGEWWVSDRYAGRYRVFGPWTADAVASFKRRGDAVSYAKAQAAMRIER